MASSPDRSTAPSGAARRALPFALFFALALLLYGKSVGYDFLETWDDGDYVLSNELIRRFDLRTLAGIFTTPILGNLAPLHILSYKLDFLFWGLNPAGYHLTNILLHGANACLLYLLLARLAGDARIALFATLLFVVHPLNVENVAWVSERKTLLAAVFTLASLNGYLAYRERGGRWSYAAAFFFALCGIFSKATAVVIPLLFVAYEHYYQSTRRKILPLVPFFILSAAGAACVLWAQRESGAFAEPLSPELLSTTVYPTMLTIYWKYLGLLIAPFGLSGYYDNVLYRATDPAVILAAFGWLLLFFLVFTRGTSRVRFWFLWFWICLLPTSNLVPLPVYYADRYMYLPAVGLFVLAALLLVRISDRLNMQGVHRAITGFAILFVLLYGFVSFYRIDVWKNELTFWEDTAAKSPNQYKARLNLGVAYEDAGRFSDAEREYERAIALYPSPYAIENLKVVREKIRISNSGR